jgi:energy-coupling factor transporter ATP-binding protein EcfA2
LELALLGVMPSNVYLLDEPTNHLDVVAREAIETFLTETPATMLVVSHDRRFLDTVCERLWVVDDGAVAPFDGGYRAWRAAVADGWTVDAELRRQANRLHTASIPSGSEALSRRSSRGAITTAVASGGAAAPSAGAEPSRNGHAAQPGGKSRGLPTTPGAPAVGAAGAVAAAAPARPKLAKLSKDAYRRQKETLDADLTRLGLRKNHLELELSKPTVQANFIELRRVTSELADVNVALAAAEDAWLALEERAP